MASLDTRTTVAAYFSTHAAAETAVSDLKQAGFTSSQIGYAGRAAEDSAFGTTAGTTSDPSYNSAAGGTGTAGSTTRAAAAKVGEKTEGAWAKIKNFFEGGDVEPYADERDRGNVSALEITDPTSSTGLGSGLETGSPIGYDGYDAADLHGSFSGLSIPEEHSRYFGHRLGRGEEGAVVTVYAESRAAEAEEILTRNGGDLGANAAGYDYASANESADSTAVAGTQRIQLLGEVLRVHKDRIQRGEVRIRKEVVTEQQTINVPVSREELVLERVAGDGSTPVSGVIGGDKEIRIPLTEERASVAKDTVVREQVSVGKRMVEETRNLNANVEHEELRVENDGPAGKDRI